MNANCLIVQSGGPTAVINNSVVGLIDEMIFSGFKGKIYGSVGGIKGLIQENFFELNKLNIHERNGLRWTPGAALGTCRYRLSESETIKIVEMLKRYHIHYFFYIGGNGSMKVAHMIYEVANKMGYYLSVIGIPKSIDNDLLETDHSPGYGSAAKFLATSVLDMKMDVASYPHSNKVTIIETMGRHTGWLAAACSLAIHEDDDSQTLIYIPESPFYIDDCIKKITEASKDNLSTFLIVAEGIKDENEQYINRENMEYDVLNRPKLGGISSFLEKTINLRTGIQARSIVPSVWQRSSVLLSSKIDVKEAYIIGKEAWKYAEKEYSGIMIGMDREYNDEGDYQIFFSPRQLLKVAGKEKFVPKEWYDSQKNRMSKEFIHYVKPLIQGEMIIPMRNGLPNYQRVI
ncbi:diphosphate--fructose-6-phosphate 1-phosphotransferase [Pseudogracilibacillus auburnensis]|uniref:diphosphate--fructose-6-phosphate 1-phosphotransferase n=1 Tax=Pseudogracilibacillus auburnensis TaxID=1494959 RepID=UPI001A956A5E|nr:diphosphate--fructose-6-phosphate 1-phosphotransferase [Pseudogracilibacillus auburnensis]MBO1002645.1 diphosphate--fructose-6-phosphate 1-phosphotransferase [Pseudogracilibacillus auburnensis]